MATTREYLAGIHDAAHDYAKLGMPIIPLQGKVPAIRAWQKFVANAVNVNFWFGPARRCNIGLRTGDSGYIVVDTDTQEAEAWVQKHLPESAMQALSGAGSKHRYYQRPRRKEIRNRQGWQGIQGLDLRGHGGYIVLPPSIHPDTGKQYQWLTAVRPPEELERFSPAWVCQRTRRMVKGLLIDEQDHDRLMYRARRYLAKIEPAVSGQGGHNKTISTATKIARFVSFDPEKTWQLLLEYNARCVPPWSERELRHKWADALKNRT